MARPLCGLDAGQAVRGFLSHLESPPGGSWDASDFAAATRRDKMGTNRISTYRSSVGMKLMFCLRVTRPTLRALRARPIHHYADLFRIAEADPQLDRFHDQVSAVEASHRVRLGGAFDVACALTIFGITPRPAA